MKIPLLFGAFEAKAGPYYADATKGTVPPDDSFYEALCEVESLGEGWHPTEVYFRTFCPLNIGIGT